MRVIPHGEPRAGERFSFSVDGVEGEAKYEVSVGKDVIARYGCPDPPCHQQVRLPTRSGGEILRIEGRDAAGPYRVGFPILEAQAENEAQA